MPRLRGRRLAIPGSTPVRKAGFVVLTVVLAAVVGVGTALAVYIGSGSHTRVIEAKGSHTVPTAAPSFSSPAPVLEPQLQNAPAARPERVSALISPLLADPKLGNQVSAKIIDVSSGETLLDSSGERPATPASTAKILTSTAALAALPPDHRIVTTAVTGDQPGDIVLIGSGDPTLSSLPRSEESVYENAPRLVDLADAVKKAKVPISRIVVDGSLFSGPTFHSSWEHGDIAAGFIAPITALMIDAGRKSPDGTARTDRPDSMAGQAFAQLLGLPPDAVVEGTAPRNARTLGQVRSAPLVQLVEHVITASDNVLAEAVARQVAIAKGLPASFDGASAAIRQQLGELGIDLTGANLADGSGLSTQDKASAAQFVAVLRAVASDNGSGLSALASGLPVAGYSGTLGDRGESKPGGTAGRVRAKTGTLTGVSSLAGLVLDADGRLLAFAVLADRVPAGGTLEAEDALDSIASALATCGCR